MKILKSFKSRFKQFPTAVITSQSTRSHMAANMKHVLLPRAFQPLPLGAIRPVGWLLRQLREQADGLSGHLDEFWPDIAESGWIGGSADGWERGPYWLDGVAPLAFLLGDERLLAKVHSWMEYILTHQREDGWLGPVRDTKYGATQEYDAWPVFVALKAMTQYQEATGDAHVLPAMERFFRRLAVLLAEKPLFEWGSFRWVDLVLSIHWLYERTQEPWLLELAATAHAQGYDWRAHFADFRFTEKMCAKACTLQTHVVNNAMAVKTSGVWYRQTGDAADRDAIFHCLETLDRFHGQVTGVFTGDEHYAGKSPSQGTELCAVVEYLFSLETLISLLGTPALADRLERIAFNALPATFTAGMWAHQYDQQVNQVLCRVAEDRVYTNNGPDANIFGLEPNYGCCTANMHQGWPKFAAHLWMRAGDGLAAVAYAPSEVTTEIDGTSVRIALHTDYPFSEHLRFVVHTTQPLRFALYLRIPAWAQGAEITCNSTAPVPVEAGAFHRLEREWHAGDEVCLRLPMPVTVERRYHQSAAIVRGPLVYSLKMGEEMRQIGGEMPHGDWEVYPTTPWNYGLRLDTAHPETSITFTTRSVGAHPFSHFGAPVIATVQGRRLPAWEIEHNAAGPLPESPLHSEEPLETLTLIPYGCTNLRVTEFPVLEEL